jgi:photosystem II stability/assembly factor-like uncharacterized protein
MQLPLKIAIWIVALCCAQAGNAHDSSAWGGLFRSRDFGASWLPADPGLYVSGALTLAIHPKDPVRLLYGTDTRFLASGNAGRDWVDAGGTDIPGGVFAVAFDAAGDSALAATARALYRSDDLLHWKEVSLPSGAAPLRALRTGATPGRVFAAGSRGLLRSDDAGKTWQSASEQMPDAAVLSLERVQGEMEMLLAIVEGQVWESTDGARTWRLHSAGFPAGRAQVIAVSAGRPWLVAADQVYVMAKGGDWIAQGRPLPEPDTSVRGLAVSDDQKQIVVSTHRGVYRSSDQGHNWQLVEGSLPVHLEAGPLLRDPHDAGTLYVGFAIQPYDETWRRASQGTGLLAELSIASLAGAAAFLVLLMAGGVVLVRWLVRVAERPR